MIKLFRNIRKKLLAEGKTTNYLKYAIGEIVLVVIGILIALSINNWNQSRLERIEEKSILANIHDEFLSNKVELEKSIAIYKSAMKGNMRLMELIGSNSVQLQKQNLDSLFYQALPATKIFFSDNAIKNIIQSGQLNIIKNPEVIQLMHEWEGTTVLVKETAGELGDWINNQYLPFLLNYVAFKEIDHNGNMPWTGRSKLSPDYVTLFQQLKFENILDNVLWYHKKNLESLESANELIKKIIDVTKSYKE
jgi:hypothetical protein